MTSHLATLEQATKDRPYVSLRQLRRWVFERRISSYRAGGRVLIDLAELDAMIAASKREAVA